MIRLAQFQDLKDIHDIARSCAQMMMSEGIFQWNNQYPSLETFSEDIARNELYIKEINGRPAGAIVISMNKDPFYNEVDWLGPETKHGYLHRLCVHPRHQGKKYATELLDFAEDLLREAKAQSVRLDAFSKNPKNNQIYLARGYTRLGDIYFKQKSEYAFHCYEKLL